MNRLRRLLPLVIFVIASTTGYLVLWPVPINPGTWTPPEPPTLTGPYQANSRLVGTERLSLGDGYAPEDVALDSIGQIYAGLDDGRIIRLQADGKNPQVFANTHGRPLGLVFDP